MQRIYTSVNLFDILILANLDQVELSRLLQRKMVPSLFIIKVFWFRAKEQKNLISWFLSKLLQIYDERRMARLMEIWTGIIQ